MERKFGLTFMQNPLIQKKIRSAQIKPSIAYLKNTPFCLAMRNMYHNQNLNPFQIPKPMITEFITLFQKVKEIWTIFSGYRSVYCSDYLLFNCFFTLCFCFYFACSEKVLQVIKNLLCSNSSENISYFPL